MEVSFSNEIRSLSLGDGETFHGEGILAVTKALLQSGVSYVGGYQGSPITHLLDVMVQARDYMDELGVHVEACTNEASAAAMLDDPDAPPELGELQGEAEMLEQKGNWDPEAELVGGIGRINSLWARQRREDLAKRFDTLSAAEREELLSLSKT